MGFWLCQATHQSPTTVGACTCRAAAMAVCPRKASVRIMTEVGGGGASSGLSGFGSNKLDFRRINFDLFLKASDRRRYFKDIS